MSRLLLVLVLVLAAGAQQLVAQTHWHTAVAASGTGSGAPDGAGTHDDCLLCQIAAHAAAAAPPVSLQQFVAPHVFAASVTTAYQHFVVLQPAHAWQSRGPPTA